MTRTSILSSTKAGLAAGLIPILCLFGCIGDPDGSDDSNASGQEWTQRVSPLHRFLNAVTWTGSQAIAVGDSGAILTSKDGIEWQSRNSGVKGMLKGVVWAGNQAIAVGSTHKGFYADTGTDSSVVLTSGDDGVSWKNRVSVRGLWFYGAAWTGLRSIIVGTLVDTGNTNGGYPTGIIFTSEDGITWTQAYKAGAGFYGVTWTGNQAVAVGWGGSIAVSPDGVDWTYRGLNIDPSFQSVAYGNGRMVAVGWRGSGFNIVSSQDGVTWSDRYSEPKGNLGSVVWAGDRFIAVGDTLATSVDGIAWNSSPSPTSHFLTSVAWTGRRIIAVGGETNIQHPEESVILTSP